MDFTHRFSGPMPMERVLSDYYKPVGGVPGFDGADILKKFSYLYLIARVYEVPRLTRQKTIGVRDTTRYIEETSARIEEESFKDLLAFEQAHDGALALVPGSVPVKKIDGTMRFTPAGLGVDVAAAGKFELGVLPTKPQDGRMPYRMNAVMALLSDEKIAPEVFKAAFADAEKNYLNFKEDAPKRQSSWLDNQARQIREQEEARRALEHDEQAALPAEHLAHAPKTSDAPAAEAKSFKPAAAEDDAGEPEEKKEKEEEKQYKWLGFKRTVEEAEDNLRRRPIPKFSTDEEDEKEPAPAPAAQDTLQNEASDGASQDNIALLGKLIAERLEAEAEKPERERSPLPDLSGMESVIGAALSIARELSEEQKA